jgi:hypothetical protein
LNEPRARRFLFDALDLVASYLHGAGVELGERPVGVRGDEESPTMTAFLAELEGRHALACAGRLHPVLDAIEDRYSWITGHRRDESRGAIRGRLDIPRYLARRVNVTLPRTYPVQTLWHAPETPENALAVQAIEGVTRQLVAAPFPPTTAEGSAAAHAVGELRPRLGREPWWTVRRRDQPGRLLGEVVLRVGRKQTGSDAAYQCLISWTSEWLLDPERLGASEKQQLLDGLLAFPTSEAFWERVFEIWCLREIAESLDRLGCARVDGPRSLRERGYGPIYRFTYNGAVVDTWFQRQKPLGQPRWRYSSGATLSGIPDIVVTAPNCTDCAPLVIDAKYRSMETETRSEETYKMLGYAQNFREAFVTSGFSGLLMFPGSQSRSTRLVDQEDGTLTLVAVDPIAHRRDAESAIDGVVGGWLSSAA